jgi:hypothetical protein
MKLLASLIAGGILSTTAVATVIDVIGPARETVGQSSIATVVRAAQPAALLENETWPEALAAAAAVLSQGGEAITVDGTVIRWAQDDACFAADVPDVWAPVVVEACPE